MRYKFFGLVFCVLFSACEVGDVEPVAATQQSYEVAVVKAAMNAPPNPNWTLADDLILAPLWKGDTEHGTLYTPLWRGSNAALEDLVYAPEDGDCSDIKGTVRIDWDKTNNTVHYLAKYRNIPVSPDIDRTEGVDFWFNPFHQRVQDFTDSGYRLWNIYARPDAPPTTMYYDGVTLELLGSEYDFPGGPPANSIPVDVPMFGLFSSDLMYPDDDGNLTYEWTMAYDHVGQEGGAVGDTLIGFVPLDLCQGNPVDPTAGQLRQYYTPWRQVNESPSWGDVLRSGLILDTTIEDGAVFFPNNDPPYVLSGVAFMGNTPALQGGIPNGMHFDLRASIRSTQPVLTAIDGGNGDSCQSFLSFPLVSGPNLCQGPPPNAAPGSDEPIELSRMLGDREEHLFYPNASPDKQHSTESHTSGGVDDPILRRWYDEGVYWSQEIEFPNRIGAAGDPVVGQGNFGIAADGTSADDTTALFNGLSLIAGQVTGNGRTCRSCHLPDHELGLPDLPLSDTLPLTDPLFTGVEADSGGEPLAPDLLDDLGLVFYRPVRFNPHLDPDDSRRDAFFWRKVPALVNTVFTFGALTDGRARSLIEASRGAAFSHTQNGDLRFDDLVDMDRLNNLSAFIEEQISQPELAALLDPQDPMYQTLVDDPFYTVNAVTQAQKRGQGVFKRNCLSCHNMPNVFSNVDHANGLPDAFPPKYGHSMDIGVAQRNFHNLEFRRLDPDTNTRVPVTIPLVAQDGTMVDWTITDDIGAAAATGRYEDLHRFKVPQLRNISQLAPYFHDNSAATLEEVVDYFTSDDYKQSADGKKHKIRMNQQQKDDLVEFLKIL